ncbi:type-I specificity determinant subunit [Staphylococcus aureus]|uniref:Type I restriction-modification system largespecifity subunit n=1 Tax=Staphylococcus aureus TaxID=1280 RepID=M1X9R1_STAAU|nr:restriction endonuclease subunit S [Staphylococcus aureus]AXP42401.1 EcoKI restriction-modification system protein HsdS [Staphylococcus aureus]AXP69939.1 EcoKI restriction-modification system protein HsdS [Staphylococcus aureus]EZY93907.1 hypothetical protein V099_02596 [Staphylococcus aureus Rd.9]MBM1045807.1 restriction endonuclease subunit S [Staphylococcus aureus]MBM1049430.1 restriction endonuclease subunit S [Staphylococcus aureus]
MTEHIKTPELRFSNFLDMWHIHKLSDVATITGGGTPSTKVSEYWNGEIDWYTPNEIGERIYAKGSKKKITNLGYKKSSTKLLPVNTILFTSRAGIGNTAILAKEGCTNQGFQSIIPNSEKIDSYFIYTISNHIKKYALKHAAGSTFLEISGKELGKMKLFLPSLKEQQKIGVFFSKLDRHIELEEKKLELLEQQKKGYMQKIFTQELKFENSQLENIKWSYKTLEELNSFFTDGNYGESYPKSEDMSDKNDGVAFLRGSNLKKGRITLEDANYISKKKHSELTTGHLFLDDIVIAVRGSLGAVGYVNENMVGNNINSQLAIIRTSSSLLYGKYLLYYLMSNQGKKELLSRVTGTALKQLPIKQIKQIKVPVPKLHEQHKIANFLSELDNLIDNQTEKMEILKQRKQGLLQKMFV